MRGLGGSGSMRCAMRGLEGEGTAGAEHGSELRRTQLDSSADWEESGTVLLVDDDPRVLSVTALLLTSVGFDVLTAGSGRDALEEFERSSQVVRVVVLDVTMPDLSGAQVLEGLRRVRPDVPVLLCSGYSEEEVLRRFDRTPRASFLQKPYPFDAFRRKLVELLESPNSTPS